MAERPQRRHRAVDVVDLPVRPPARRVVAVGLRHLADVARHGDRQPATRLRVAREDLGDRRRPGLARHPGEDHGRAVLECPFERERAGR